MSLYLNVAQEFEDQIRAGLIVPGDKLPSVRRLATNRKISASTVVQAYMTLEARGLIEARPQSGYYALAPLGPAVTLKMTPQSLHHGKVKTSEIVDGMRKFARDADFFQLGCALMDEQIFPLKRLSRLLAKAVKDRPEAMVQMDFPPGSLRLRRQIARRYSELGCRVKPDDLIITSGCNEAITLALRAVVKPGDTVLVESPTYFGVLEILQSMGLKVVEVPCDAETGIQLEAVRDAFRRFPIRAGFIIPNFNNPTGSLMPDENKRDLVEIFSKAGATLIEDDIFSELSFSQNRPKPLRYFDKGGTVITCSSFTKTVGPGLRVGWILAGDRQSEIESAKYLLNGGTPLVMSELVADFLESGSYERYLRRVRQTLAIQVARVSEAVVRLFPEGTQISRPQGGYVLWVRLPKGADGVALYRKALDAKINFAPGIIFSASGAYSNYLRISCGSWSPTSAKAVTRLAGLV